MKKFLVFALCALMLFATHAQAQELTPSDRAMVAASNQMLLESLDKQEKAVAALIDARQDLQKMQWKLEQLKHELDKANETTDKAKHPSVQKQ